MKKTLVFILTVFIFLFLISSCAKKTQKVDFVQLCFDENPTRAGLPLSQVELLYEGVMKAGDTAAKQTLIENCPKAAAGYLR